MELKKYKRKREIPIGWKEIKLGDVFRTSSGATPLTTELSYYEGGNIPWINSGELASPYIYSTSNYITQKGLIVRVRKFIQKELYLWQCMELLQEKPLC